MAAVSSRIILCATAVVVLSLHCGDNNPTQQDRYNALKQEFVAVADQIKPKVEQFRGKPFKRSVAVTVFSPAEYKSKISGSSGPLSPAHRKIYNDIFKCQGLLHPDGDYFAAYNAMLSGETSGFYVDGTDSLFVVLGEGATELTGYDYVTLFHEFVHALQDQYFNLTSIQEYSKTWNRRLGMQYVVEGEATLLSDNFIYYLIYNAYPTTTDTVLKWLEENAADVDRYLDSLHTLGKPLVVRQPTYWAYYSYGPKFINAIAGTNWTKIDGTVFPRLPFGVGLVLHPESFPNETVLHCGLVNDAVNASQRIIDVDEFGEVITSVLFREWNFSNYASIAKGLVADNAVVYADRSSDSARFIWYTLWKDSTESAEFWTSYISLLNAKRSITLPPAVQRGDTSVINDLATGMYLEKFGTHVFVLERYVPATLNEWVEKLRAVTFTPRSFAKSAQTAPYPCLDKSALLRGLRGEEPLARFGGIRGLR